MKAQFLDSEDKYDGSQLVSLHNYLQHKLLGELMLIRRHIAPKHHEGGLAVALADVAEHLIVGAIFFDDIDNMLNF